MVHICNYASSSARLPALTEAVSDIQPSSLPEQHLSQFPVPEFRGDEYWSPACGGTSGIDPSFSVQKDPHCVNMFVTNSAVHC